LHSAILFEGSVDAGHVTSLVRSKNENVFRRFNDDAVFDLRRRSAMKALKENRFGFPYGLVYIRQS